MRTEQKSRCFQREAPAFFAAHNSVHTEQKEIIFVVALVDVPVGSVFIQVNALVINTEYTAVIACGHVDSEGVVAGAFLIAFLVSDIACRVSFKIYAKLPGTMLRGAFT